tara:strand:- start:133 stop:384 length:252 start_codon:yes stop_codon:yes gene_type:complete
MTFEFESFSVAEKDQLLKQIQLDLYRLIQKNQADSESIFNTHYLNYVESHIELIESIRSSNNLNYLLDENLYMRLRIISENYL